MMDYELDQLRREFLADAYAKIREMESKIDRNFGPDSAKRLGDLAHQLKGSGGSYGFQRISSDAAELEKAVQTLAREKIEKRVASLRAEIVRQSEELAAAS